MNSKGDFSFNQLLLLVVTIFAAIIIMAIFSRVYGGEAKQTLNLLDGAKDYDTDGRPNQTDKCPCDNVDDNLVTTCPKDTKECQKEMVMHYEAERKRAG